MKRSSPLLVISLSSHAKHLSPVTLLGDAYKPVQEKRSADIKDNVCPNEGIVTVSVAVEDVGRSEELIRAGHGAVLAVLDRGRVVYGAHGEGLQVFGARLVGTWLEDQEL